MPLSKALVTFLTVVEVGSLNKAAAALHTSVPPLSRQIKLFETRIGLTLFTRHPTGLRLTPDGELFYRTIKPAIETILDAIDTAGSNRKKIIIGAYKITAGQTYCLTRGIMAASGDIIEMRECSKLTQVTDYDIIISSVPVVSASHPRSYCFRGSVCLLTSKTSSITEKKAIPLVQHNFDPKDYSDFPLVEGSYGICRKVITREDILTRLDMVRSGEYASFVATEVTENCNSLYIKDLAIHQDVSMSTRIFIYSRYSNAEFRVVKQYYEESKFYTLYR